VVEQHWNNYYDAAYGANGAQTNPRGYIQK
jgi:hypothetical protein